MRRGRVRRCRQAGGQRTSSEGRRVCQRCALENEGVTSGLRGSPRAESGDRRPKRREVGRASMQAAALQAQGGACTWHARALRLPSGRAGRAGRGLGGSARAERLGGKRLRGLEGGAHRAHGLRSSGTASCVNFTSASLSASQQSISASCYAHHARKLLIGRCAARERC